MDTKTILQEFESLPHTERVRRIVELGRASKRDDGAKAIIQQLSIGSLYEQALSVESCFGSRNVAIAKAALLSQSRHLKKRAITLIAHLGNDEELYQAIKIVPEDLQLLIIRRLRDNRRLRKRSQVIERFLEDLEETGGNPYQFQTLFLLGSNALVERNLVALVGKFTMFNWTRLAKYHHDITIRVLNDWIDRSGSDDPLLKDTINELLSWCMSHDYSVPFAYDILKTALKKLPIEPFPIYEMALKKPNEVVEIVLDCKSELSEHDIINFNYKILNKLTMENFVAMYKRYPNISSPMKWAFSSLIPEQRLLMYREVSKGWRDERGVLKYIELSDLPTEERIKEARRHLKLPKFQTRPADRIEYIAYLPWDEAMEMQKQYIRSGDADVRSKALKAQIQAVKFDDKHIKDAVQLVLNGKNDQDPVRLEMAAALSSIPRGRWKEEHLDGLAQVVRNTLDTSTTSNETVSKLFDLLTNILSTHPNWAAKQLVIIFREHSNQFFEFELTGAVPIKDVMAIVQEEFSPILKQMLEKQDGEGLTNISIGFHKYLKYWPEFLEKCEEFLDIPDERFYHGGFVDILYANKRDQWARIIRENIGNEEVAGHRRVMMWVRSKQQNLLGTYLVPEEQRPGLKFQFEELGLECGWTWTPTQQEKFSELLLTTIGDEDAMSREKTNSVLRLSQLAFISPEPILALANSDVPIIAETAVKALGKLDNDVGLPVLVEALSDDRARFAIYSLRAILKSTPKDQTLNILTSVPQTKVTVAKDIIRMIGDLKTDAAYQYLLSKDKEDLHIDVRLALLKALYMYLQHDESWKIYTTATEFSNGEIANVLAQIPAPDTYSPAHQSFIQILYRLLLHSSAEIRVIALQRIKNNILPLQDEEHILYSPLRKLIYSTFDDENDAAPGAIFRLYSRISPELIGHVFRQLLKEKERKVLERVSKAYLWHLDVNTDHTDLNNVTKLLLEILKEDRLSITRRVKLIFSLPFKDSLSYIKDIIPELHADALGVMENAIVDGSQNGWKLMSDELEELEKELAASEDEKARRLAVSCLEAGVSETVGWMKEERERLEKYRGDESVLVAEAAWAVGVPNEEDEDEE